MRTHCVVVLAVAVLLILLAAAPCRAANEDQVVATCDWMPPQPPPQKPGGPPVAAPMVCYPHSCTLDLSSKDEPAQVLCHGRYSCEAHAFFSCTVGDNKLYTCKANFPLLNPKEMGPFRLTQDQLVNMKTRCETMCGVCKTGWRKP